MSVDLSPGMIEQARAVQPDVSFSAASLEKLPHAGDSFDGTEAQAQASLLGPLAGDHEK